jgi:hypothetical protein
VRLKEFLVADLFDRPLGHGGTGAVPATITGSVIFLRGSFYKVDLMEALGPYDPFDTKTDYEVPERGCVSISPREMWDLRMRDELVFYEFGFDTFVRRLETSGAFPDLLEEVRAHEKKWGFAPLPQVLVLIVMVVLVGGFLLRLLLFFAAGR